MTQTGTRVLLSCRLPRITVWRNLKRLGVAQLADALAALPADARTREQLEWIAEQVTGFGGDASIWIAQPASLARQRQIVSAMSAARAEEYQEVIDEAGSVAGLDEGERQRIATRLGAKLRRIQRRDFFPPAEREPAAVHTLAVTAEMTAEVAKGAR